MLPTITLPTVRLPSSPRYKDKTLSALCAQSRMALSRWKASGCPSSGSLHEEKCRLRRAVRRRVHFCAAQAEKRRTQRRERLFAANDRKHFRTSKMGGGL